MGSLPTKFYLEFEYTSEEIDSIRKFIISTHHKKELGVFENRIAQIIGIIILVILFIAFLKYNDIKTSLILIAIILGPIFAIFLRKKLFKVRLNMGEGLDSMFSGKMNLNISEDGLSIKKKEFTDFSSQVIPWDLLSKIKIHDDMLILGSQFRDFPISIPLRVVGKDKELFLRVIDEKLS